jgi:hypothetical protein
MDYLTKQSPLMTLKTLAIGLAGILFWVPCSFADAGVCGDRKQLTELLRERYNETWKAEGLADDGLTPVELFVSPRGSWTAVVILAGQTICVVATGKSIKDIPKSMRWLET